MTKHLAKSEDFFLLLSLSVAVLFLIVVSLIPMDSHVGIISKKKVSQVTFAEERRQNRMMTTEQAQNASSINENNPLQGNNFKIEYNQDAKVYIITTEAKDISEFRSMKLDIEKALNSSGITDLCAVRVIFMLPKDSKKDFQPQDLFPSGCSQGL